MKHKVLILTAFVVVLAMLSACAADTLLTTYFRRVPNYTTISEVVGLLDAASGGDLSPDQTVELVGRWADAKYQTSDRSATGFEAKDRLNVAYGNVGVLQVGPYQLILPPRTYANLPVGDDELQVVKALCVQPGMIAWRFNYSSQLEVREPRAECYLLPEAGWQVVESLRVDQGYMAYRMKEDGSYEFRGPTPGVYPSEIKSLWVIVPAVQITPDSFGVYVRPDGALEALNTGIHYDVVPGFVNVYKSDEMRFRTLSLEVYGTNSTPESPACSSELCDTIIDKIIVAGTQRLASFNVDVGFKAENPYNNAEVLVKYTNLGPMQSAIVDYIEGPTREAVRSVGSDMTQQQLESEAGKAEFEKRVLYKVQSTLDQKGIPLKLTYVNLRSRNFNDADLRAAAAEAEVQLQRENDRIAAANARAKAIDAETVALAGLQQQVELKMESASKVVNSADGISCTELALLSHLGLINVDWSTMPKEMCITGNTAITVTAP